MKKEKIKYSLKKKKRKTLEYFRRIHPLQVLKSQVSYEPGQKIGFYHIWEEYEALSKFTNSL